MHSSKDTPLAIIGMACRVPGANNLDEFWQLLVDGRSAVGEAPADRFNRRLHFDPQANVPYKSYTVTGGTLSYPPFDAGRCPVPAKTFAEAEIGHHTICQVAADACRHAGLNPFDLPIRNAGVYIGHNLGGPVGGNLIYSSLVESTAQYLLEVDEFLRATSGQSGEVVSQLVRQIRDRLPQRGPTGSPDCATRLGSMIISESLGLTGPSMILDAACSSALQGLAMAARGLQLGRIEMAVVGGASYYYVDSQLIFSRAQSASRRAISCPFDAEADGLVSGEGYVAVIVKTLERALADGDPIQCVIRGIGVSSDGRGKSLWAPRKEGQTLAIRRAYERGLDPARLQYIEAHATSTRIGDVTELKALAEVLREYSPTASKIPLGGVKANIGHTLESAGLAGLVKTVLAMQHQIIPRQINVSNLNPEIDWGSAPFYVPTANVPWRQFDDGHPRRAAVNSFGIGGLNVHVVIDEHSAQPVQTAQAKPRRAAAAVPPAHEPIAIVGASCIFPGARTLEAFWELLASGRDPKCDAPDDRWNTAVGYEPGSRRQGRSPTKRGGFVTDFKYDWRRHKLPPNQVDKADPLQFMILDATDAALADAGYDKRPYDKSRVGVVAGTVFCSDFCEQLLMGFRLPDFCDNLAQLLRSRGIAEDQIARISQSYIDILLKHKSALLDETGSFTPSTLVSRITKMFDLMGGAATIDAGQASSLAAVYTSVDMLLDGTCDMVVCAGGHRAMGLSTFEAMAIRGELADDHSPAPFDANARGHLPGEGVGVVLLKRLADAERDGDPIRGIIRGVGAGFSIDRRESVAHAIRQAQSAAGPATTEVLLETSGVGDVASDDLELSAVIECQGTLPRSQPMVVSSLVGQIGHTQGASGMASLLAAVGALDRYEIALRPGMTSPTPFAAAHPTQIRLASSKLPLTSAGKAEEMLAGVNNLDCFGAAYHLVLQRGISKGATAAEPAPTAVVIAAPQATSSTTSWRIVRFAAPSPEALRELVASAAPNSERLFAEAGSSNYASGGTSRLAIVAGSAADLAEKLTLAGSQLGTPKEVLLAKKDIFVGTATSGGGQVAFMFAGQGSQYPGMLKSLIEQFPPAAEALSRIDETLVRLGISKFAEFAWENPEELGKDVWLTQLSLLCADTIVCHSLEALGIEPSWVAGHSFGEFPALAAAGAWDFENAVLGTRARCEAIEAAQEARGGMLSVAASGEVVERFCREVGGEAFPANYNAPQQTVVGGTQQALDELEVRLKAQKIGSKRLAVPRPFHTPLMRDTQPKLAAALASLVIQSPRVTVLSSVTNRPVASADEVRSNLVAQMISPVRYVDLVKQLVGHGVRALVEVGPHQVLSGLNQQILANQDVLVIASDDKARGGLPRLLAVKASLEVRGFLERAASETPAELPAASKQLSKQPPHATSSPGRNGHSAPKIRAAGVGSDAPGISDSTSESLVLQGSAYEIGLQHGRAMARPIQNVARRYADISGIDGDDAAEIEPLLAAAPGLFDHDEREELRGIAEGAGVSAAMLAVFNAWSDLYQAQAAAHLTATPDDAGSNLLHAFQERSAARRPWGDLGLPTSLRIYRPASRLAYALVAWPGMIGAAAGMNEQGLAITSANSAEIDTAAAPAALRCLLVQRVLRQASTLDAAIELLSQESGNLAAEFCVSHPAATEVRYVRLSRTGKPQVTARPALVAVVESRQLEAAATTSVRSVDSSGLTPGGNADQEFPPELLALADEFGGQSSPPANYRARLRHWAVAHMAVVMDCTAREIAFRGEARHDQGTVSRYRFETPTIPANPLPAKSRPALPQSKAPAPAADSPRIAAMPLSEYVSRSGSVRGAAPFDEGGRTCQRFVLRSLRTSIPAVEESLRTLEGTAMIVGRNAVGNALRRQIEALGGKAVVVPMSDDVEKTLAAVDKIWQAYRPLHLFLVTPFDDDATTSLRQGNWDHRRLRGVNLPYLICQRWFTFISDEKLVTKASIAASTSLGGDFGLSTRVDSPESGAITGLLKSLCLEFGYTTKWAFRTKIIDAPRNEPPEDIAAAMLLELRALSPFVEIGYSRGERFVIGAVHEATRPKPQNVPTRGQPWLLTGGARGITAAVARELGSRFGVKLHLVGASPRPQLDPGVHHLDAEALKQLRVQMTQQATAEKKPAADVWRSFQKAVEIDKTIRDLESAGISVRYHACDVGNRQAVAQLIDEIRRTDGPLEGIVHGAGIEVSSRFTKKDRKIVERTIASKVDGAAHLMELTCDDPLRFFFGFGSISGRWGSIGQSDYCLASDMLAKLVTWFRSQRPDCHAACFHWQPWAEIGMAAREETRGGKMLQGIVHLPAAEGSRHFIDEMLGGCPDGEVVITDWSYYKRYHPDLSKADQQAIFVADRATSAPVARPASVANAAKTAAAKPAVEPSVSQPAAISAVAGEATGSVALRQLMRLVPSSPDAPRKAFAFTGAALILGECDDAQALSKRLAAKGVQALQIPIADTIEQTLLELERLFAANPAPHLFVMTGRESQAAAIDSPETWCERSQRGVLLPYAVCQKWLAMVGEAELLDRASLVAATSLGGDFGFAQPVPAPEGGALTGLLKGLYMEFVQPQVCQMRIKVVDAAPDEPPAQLAAALIEELDFAGFDVEAAYRRGKRRVVRLLEQPVDRALIRPIERGGVWIFTGGARGITAAVAKEMARRFGLKVHLLGYSPLRPIDESLRGNDQAVQALKPSLLRKAMAAGLSPGTYWEQLRKELEIDRTLQDLASLGVKATYHHCDVTKLPELAATLESIRAVDGPIRGIVHGAGLQSAPKSIDKSEAKLTWELCQVKVDAALNLMLLTAQDPIRYFVGFGSVSARFGSTNAAAYTLANDLLCKLIGWYRHHRPDCHAVGFHWHPWGEVGMMTRPVSQHTIKVFKMAMMSPAEGSAHLIDELSAGTPESEVLITDHRFRDAFFSLELMVPGPQSRTAPTESTGAGALIERVVEQQAGRRAVAEILLHPVNDPFLREHRLRSRPTLPLVVAIEAFVETAQLVVGGQRTIVACRDVEISDAVRFFADEPLVIKVAAEAGGPAINCRLTSDFKNRRGQLVQKDRAHFSACLETADRIVRIEAPLPPTLSNWFDVKYPTTEAPLYHGAPLQMLKRMGADESQAVGEIHFPPQDDLPGQRRGAWRTPSAAIDACLYACGVYTWIFGNQGFTVPQRLGELRFGRPARPGEKALVHVVPRELQENFGLFDFTLFGADGAVIVQAGQYRCHVLRDPGL